MLFVKENQDFRRRLSIFLTNKRWTFHFFENEHPKWNGWIISNISPSLYENPRHLLRQHWEGFWGGREIDNICTGEWCRAIEFSLDEMAKDLYSICEPRWSSSDYSRTLRNMRRRLHDLYSNYERKVRHYAKQHGTMNYQRALRHMRLGLWPKVMPSVYTLPQTSHLIVSPSFTCWSLIWMRSGRILRQQSGVPSVSMVVSE